MKSSFLVVLLIAIPFICAAIPVFLRNWKALLIWHVIFSILISYLLAQAKAPEHGASGGGASDAVGAGGVAIYALILLVFHLASMVSKGIEIYVVNERGIKLFPIYAIVAVLSYIAIFVIILLIGTSLFPVFLH